MRKTRKDKGTKRSPKRDIPPEDWVSARSLPQSESSSLVDDRPLAEQIQELKRLDQAADESRARFDSALQKLVSTND